MDITDAADWRGAALREVCSAFDSSVARHHVEVAGSDVKGGGSFKTNPIGAPGVCVALMHFARRNDRLELTPRSTACVMASTGKDGNLCGDVVGCGVLK